MIDLYSFRPPMGRVFCKDGFSVSIQAREGAYCKPRNNDGPYVECELGFPSSDPPSSWAEYADGEFPSDVYAYVPMQAIQELIDLHGGIDIEKTLNSILKAYPMHKFTGRG